MQKNLIVKNRGIKLGILTYTYGTNGIILPDNKNFMVSYIDTIKMKEDIIRLNKSKLDKIITYIHWGNEYDRLPNFSQKKIADFVIRNGVNIIFGSHPHVIQPAETKIAVNENGKEKKVFVIYSLGNFISNQMIKYTNSGVICNLSIVKNFSTN